MIQSEISIENIVPWFRSILTIM